MMSAWRWIASGTASVTYFCVIPATIVAATYAQGRSSTQSNNEAWLLDLINDHGLAAAALIVIAVAGMWILRTLLPYWVAESKARLELVYTMRAELRQQTDLMRRLENALRDLSFGEDPPAE